MGELAMGGYAAYVWSCFAVTAVIFVLNEWRARLNHRRVYRDIEVRIKAIEEHQ